MKRYAISDIHGCLKSFKALLERIQFSREDELYLLGDYIDRGPDSKGLIDYLWQLESEGHQLSYLRGNHDQILLDSVSDPEWEQSWLQHGGKETLKSFGVAKARDIPGRYLRFFDSLPYYFEVGRYILVHAGLSFQTSDPLENSHDLMWARYWYQNIDYDWLGDRIIVHGHTPTHHEEIRESLSQIGEVPAIGIDNGCVYIRHAGLGALCAFELGEQQLTFQPCID